MNKNNTFFSFNVDKYNGIVEKCGLNRQYTFDKFNKNCGDYTQIECTFSGFGKNLGRYHVLIENIKFDEDEFEENIISHMWLNNATNPNCYVNWMQWNYLIPGDVILLSGYVSFYDDANARKSTLINTNVERIIWRPQH